MMKAAIYLRGSTDEQHPEKYESACRRFAEGRGYEVEGIYLEHISAYKRVQREKYEAIKAKAYRGEISAVIVWALDRWVRNRDTLLDDVTVLRAYGCKLHSVCEQWLEAINIEGSLGRTIQDFLLGLIGSLAEMESQRKSERVRAAYQSHHGRKWGRPALHTNKKKIVWNLLGDGMSLRAIAQASGLSLGAVHKIKAEKDGDKPPTGGGS